MVVKTPIQNLQLEPGSRVQIPNVSWQEFEEILQELDESRGSRISYSQGVLEIMAPLPDHERAIVLNSQIVLRLLDHQQRPWESLCSTTFKAMQRCREVGTSQALKEFTDQL